MYERAKIHELSSIDPVIIVAVRDAEAANYLGAASTFSVAEYSNLFAQTVLSYTLFEIDERGICC